MEPVIPDLYASDPRPLPFAPSQGMRAFLVRRDAGNLLIYSAPGVDADAVAALGGATRILLGHWHEGEFGGGEALAAALDAPLTGERAAPHEPLGDDVQVIPIPGHTPGATAYLWNGVLFPAGDTIYVDGGEWVAAVLDSSDRAAYVESLERLRELDFELLVPWAASLDGDYAVATDRADAQRRIDAILARVRRGESR
jgi:glyoxylase-like metal-dependent hydrolase (beta-lactamase superfamily II)